jgi:large subunit ribosomal protein L35
MPKMKTKKSVAKRFRLTKKGKIKREKAGKGHLLTHKSRKRKRWLRKLALVDPTMAKKLKRLLPYG